MANLFFPQLTSGASAQYPIGKSRFIRTVQNVMADGSFYVGQDLGAGRMQWQLSYVDLSFPDATALQTHFDQCAGPVQPFTFIDPTDNMLLSSADFRQPPWQQMPAAELIALQPGAADPFGGADAWTATNITAAQLTQTFTVPAHYQYCFSLYACSVGSSAPITLTRSGLVQSQSISCAISPTWTRLVSTGRLNESGTQFTISIGLPSGKVLLYGPQLEAQVAPSRYRATTARGGIYSNAHWAVEELPIVAQAPNLYSVAFTIEAAVQG